MEKKKIKDPLRINECDTGTIGNNIHSNNYNNFYKEIGEILDVYCVAKNNKSLAALDFSTYGKNKYKKMNRILINKIIDFCNYKKVKVLHNKKRGGMYLKSIFFTEKNYKNALKLMDILWNPTPIFDGVMDIHVAIGLLLGYSHENIIAFLEKNYNVTFKPSKILYAFKNIQQKIDNLNVSLETLNKHSNIQVLDIIPSI